MSMNRTICRECKYCPHVLCHKSINRIFIICNRGYLGLGKDLIVSEIDENLYKKINRYACFDKNAKTRDRNLLSTNNFSLQDKLDNVLRQVAINKDCPFYLEQLIIGE